MRNPVKRGLAAAAERWAWSSYRAYAFGEAGCCDWLKYRPQVNIGAAKQVYNDVIRPAANLFVDAVNFGKSKNGKLSYLPEASLSNTAQKKGALQITLGMQLGIAAGFELPNGALVVRNALTDAQTANLSRFEESLPNGEGPTTIKALPNDGRAFQAEVPADNIPGSKAVYENQVGAVGKTINYPKTTYDPNGDVVHTKVK